MWKSTDVDNWCVPFQGSDRSVISRTQRYLHDEKNQRAVSKSTSLKSNHFLNVYVCVKNEVALVLKNLQPESMCTHTHTHTTENITSRFLRT